MAENVSSLRDFVVNYCQMAGGIIESPEYGIDEVLLPEQVAARWGVDAFQRFRFSAASDISGAASAATYLYYGHPLVEAMVDEVRRRPADSLFFINPLRVEKPGLNELVEKLTFANARPTAGDVQRNRLYHYVCFNFKASLISDEKRELLVPLWMHVQGGNRVSAQEILANTSLDTEPGYPNLDAASPGWRTVKSNEDILSAETLSALLQRARLAILDEINPTIEAARARSLRFLDLDRARLNDYYDHLQGDLVNRLSRADNERRPSLEAKLAALQVERGSKLMDAEQKYCLRLDLELINLAIIVQPKIEVEVEIRKRGVEARRRIAWDPVRHILELPVCDVCSRPGEGLALCESGHLAHAACLAPQCVDCKRAFCARCVEKIHVCVVCDSPVCVHSLVRCPTCGRETCQSHPGLCHAAGGQPQKVITAAPATVEPLSPKAETPTPGAVRPTKPSAKNGKAKTQPPSKKTRSPAIQTKTTTAQQIQVEIETTIPMVRAYALSRGRQVALRIWELDEQGILVYCRCEKGPACLANQMAYRPAPADQIEAQLIRLIHKYAEEYRVPDKKISYLRMTGGGVYEARRLNLPAIWKDPEKLASANKGFDKLSGSHG